LTLVLFTLNTNMPDFGKKLILFLVTIVLTPILFFFLAEVYFQIFNPKLDVSRWTLFKSDINSSFKQHNFNNKYRLKVDWTSRQESRFQQPSNEHQVLQRSGDLWFREETGFTNLRERYKAFQKAIHPSTNEIIYDVRYTLDEYRRRWTDAHSSNANKHLILSGCSATFGEGINDNETLSHHLQKKLPDTNVFNLGIPGGSVVTALTTITTAKNWDGIFPQKGLLLFSFSAQTHMPRYLGSIMTVGGWYHYGAYLKKNRFNNYEFGGIYYLHKPVLTGLSQILSKSKLLAALDFDWPMTDENALDEYAQAIHQLRIEYRRKYHPQNELIVYLWPGERDSRAIIPFLEKYQIHYLDYSDFELEKYATKDLFIKWDHHPTEEFNQILAAQIASDLAIPENKINLEKSISAE
jgi:hypothetical protein